MALVLLLALLIVQPCQALAPDRVFDVQRRLVELGFLEREPDGIYGDQTAAALERLAVYAANAQRPLTGDALTTALLAGEIPLVSAEIRHGDKSENVMRAQRRLRVLGYLADKADGRFGDNTRRALLVFQHAAGLALSGAGDADTQARLFAGDAPAAAHPVLAKGMKGERVTDMQNRLARLGFFIGLCDGQYGDDTVLGVKAFQSYVITSGHYGALDAKLRDAGPNGLADPLVLALLYSDDFPMPEPLAQGASGQEVYRLQRRLIALTYLTGNPDGGYGEATKAAVEAFQRRNELKPTGAADSDTLARLFSDQALGPLKPYKLVVSLSKQELYVYALDKSGAYGKLTSTMRCSTGPRARPGEYAALTGPADAEWAQTDGHWVRYPYPLDGAFMIHSIPYTQKQGDVLTQYLRGLGAAADVGGVMLSVEDARLVYEKCPRYTPVEVVE